jgi:hypothetical protein
MNYVDVPEGQTFDHAFHEFRVRDRFVGFGRFGRQDFYELIAGQFLCARVRHKTFHWKHSLFLNCEKYRALDPGILPSRKMPRERAG